MTPYNRNNEEKCMRYSKMALESIGFCAAMISILFVAGDLCIAQEQTLYGFGIAPDGNYPAASSVSTPRVISTERPFKVDHQGLALFSNSPKAMEHGVTRSSMTFVSRAIAPMAHTLWETCLGFERESVSLLTSVACTDMVSLFGSRKTRWVNGTKPSFTTSAMVLTVLRLWLE